MKALSLGLLTLALVCITFSSATPPRNAVYPTQKKAVYYWYWADSDFYITTNSTPGAINDLESMTGDPVDTNPYGNRLANGYVTNSYPHTMWPSVILYSH